MLALPQGKGAQRRAQRGREGAAHPARPHLDGVERGVGAGQQRRQRGGGQADVVGRAHLDLALAPAKHGMVGKEALGAGVGEERQYWREGASRSPASRLCSRARPRPQGLGRTAGEQAGAGFQVSGSRRPHARRRGSAPLLHGCFQRRPAVAARGRGHGAGAGASRRESCRRAQQRPGLVDHCAAGQSTAPCRQGCQPVHHPPTTPPPQQGSSRQALRRQAVERALLVPVQQLRQHTQQALHHGRLVRRRQARHQRRQQARQQRRLRARRAGGAGAWVAA